VQKTIYGSHHNRSWPSLLGLGDLKFQVGRKRQGFHFDCASDRDAYGVVAVYGLIALSQLYFLVEKIGRDTPAPITHPEFYYGFVGRDTLAANGLRTHRTRSDSLQIHHADHDSRHETAPRSFRLR
jgi:hypothetical protein